MGHEGVTVVALPRPAVRLNAFLFSMREHHSNLDNLNYVCTETLHYLLYQNHGCLQPYYIIMLLHYFVISAAPEVPGSFPEKGRKVIISFLIDEPLGSGIN